MGLAMALGALTTMPALASASGSTTGTIHLTNPSLLSLTVDPTTIEYCSESVPLTFPNGQCLVSPGVTITFGSEAGRVDINGGDAFPSDGGTHWTLCGASGPTCTGTDGQPGPDQFLEAGFDGAFEYVALNNSPQCDMQFDAAGGGAMGCSASPNQVATEERLLIGPSSSTDVSLTFTTPIVWTAVP